MTSIQAMEIEMIQSKIQAPRGRQLRCLGWHQEAALRMLMNNLDPEVAERPDELIVYGGSGKAARNWECYQAIVAALEKLKNDETLLVQSGKPVGVFRTHEYCPRVLIANSNLVGNWATWEEFRRLEALGLMMYGQMTAGSWIYIGSQGIVQGTYETFASVARKHFGGTLSGKILVSGGLGGMGGAQPLAATMAGAVFIGVEVDPERIQKRLRTGYCDRMSWDLDEALRSAEAAAGRGEALSIGLVGNCAEVLPELVRRGFTPDVLTDQTSAHDPLNGYVPGRHAAAGRPESAPIESGGVLAPQHGFHRRPRASHARSAGPGRGHFRLRKQHTRPGPEGRRRKRPGFPGLRPRLTSGRYSAKGAARFAGPRSQAILRTLP